MNGRLMASRMKNDALQIISNAARSLYTMTQGALTGDDQFGNHDIDKECGYPESLTPEALWKWFKREDMGYRMVVIKPETCWASNPTIIENNDAVPTDFEKSIVDLNKNFNLWNYLQRADVVSGIGDFGVMMLGINDGKDFATPVEGVDGGTEGLGRSTKKHKLEYIRIFAQHQITVATTVNDPKNARFGLPEMYTLLFENEDYTNSGGVAHTKVGAGTDVVSASKNVHWTRIVHMADNRDTSDVFGNSRLQRIYNRLLDLRKVVGGSGEMYWKGAFPGLSLESQPDFADAEFNKEEVKKSLDDYQNGLNRYLALQGITVKSLTPQVIDPTSYYKMLVMAIAICEGIPYRILLGAEEGKQAGNQDAVQWNKKMEGRREQYLNPWIIKPVIDRLIAMGVLEEVEYKIKWAPLNEQTLSEQIENALNRTKALAEYMRGGVDMIVTPEDFLKIFLKMDDGEVKTIIDNMDGELGLDRVDESGFNGRMDPVGNPQGQQSKIDENKV